MYRLIMVAAAVGCMLGAQQATADQGSEYRINPRLDDGLSRHLSLMICARAEQPSRIKGAVFTPDKVRGDLLGRSVGPVAEVKVKTGAVYGDRSGASTEISSAHVHIPLPMGVIFDQTTITDLAIREVKISGTTATLVVQVETVSNYAGMLRLGYEHVADEWVLREIENLSFKAQ